MQPSDKAKFSQIVMATFELYGKQPSKLAVDMFWRVLERFSIDQVENGFAAHLNDPEYGKFQPKPADIIRHIEGCRDDRMAAAGLAYAKAMGAIGSCGSYRSPVFDDPAIHYAIRNFGGWVKFCQAEQHDFDRKKFVEEYAVYKPGLPYPPCLDGLTAIENGSQFASWNEIIPIGNVEACRNVYRGGSALTHENMAIPAEVFAGAMKAIGGEG